MSYASEGSATARTKNRFRHSVLVKLIAFGLLLILLALSLNFGLMDGLLGPELSGIWATFTFLWGIALAFIGSVGRIIIWWGRR